MLYVNYKFIPPFSFRLATGVRVESKEPPIFSKL